MNPFRRETQRRECFFHVGHEATRPAEVDVSVLRDADSIERGSRQMTGCVEILDLPVARARPAVADIAPAVRECEDQPADLRGEWMVLSILGPVEP